MGAAAPVHLRLDEAEDALRSPYALERYSVLSGAPLVVVHCEEKDRVSPELSGALRRLACPNVAVHAADEGGARFSAFDLAFDDESRVAVVEEAVAQNPLAALALVQLLRVGDQLELHEALVAESLVYSTLQAGPEFAEWLRRRGEPARADPEPGPAVRVERFHDQLVISLNRPRRHNAFSVEIRDALAEALAMAVADTSVSEIVLRGEGPSFSSGGDLSEFGDLPDPATAHAVRATRNPARLLALCAIRVQARVHGACIGAGCELPAFAARVVAAPGAFFQLPEVAMGLVPGAGGTASLPQRIGRQRTAWLALSRERIDAETALAWGLVDEIAG